MSKRSTQFFAATHTLAILLALAGSGWSQSPPMPGDHPPYPPIPVPAENPLTQDKILLGKILFWEEQLSSDDTMACGTCHIPGAGGTDPRSAGSASDHPGPDGVLGTGDDVIGSRGVIRCLPGGQFIDDGVFFPDVQRTGRKAPSALDAMHATDTFWDGRATSQFIDPETGSVAIASGGALESQAVGPPVSDVEMACQSRNWSEITFKIAAVTPLRLASNLPADVTAQLQTNPTYPDLFNAAFGSPVVTAKRIAFAIASYERTLASDQTPWDQFNAGNAGALTPQQLNGLDVFMTNGRCHLCHTPPLFTDNQFHNIGLVDPNLDPGRMAITTNPADLGKFKTPSLRNAGLREPSGLFHIGTGSGSTLDAVVNFYDGGGTFMTNIDPMMQSLGLTPVEINDLVDFVRNGLTDPRAAAELPPFDRPTLHSELQGGPQANPMILTGTGFGDVFGGKPQMIATQPPHLMQASQTIGVANLVGGTVAVLALGNPGVSLINGVLPTAVDLSTALQITIFPTAGTWPNPGEGYASVGFAIPNLPFLIGFSIYGQWAALDPNGLFTNVTTSDASIFTVMP